MEPFHKWSYSFDEANAQVPRSRTNGTGVNP